MKLLKISINDYSKNQVDFLSLMKSHVTIAIGEEIYGASFKVNFRFDFCYIADGPEALSSRYSIINCLSKMR
jgi:hypothetical protein